MVGIVKYRWCVIVKKNHGCFYKNQVISKYEFYEDALKEIENNPNLDIKHITELPKFFAHV